MSSSQPTALGAQDPVIEALDRAPRVQRLTPEERVELERDMEDIVAGRVQLVAHEDVPAWLEMQSARAK